MSEPHLFLNKHNQGYLSNPANMHLRVPKGEDGTDYRLGEFRGYDYHPIHLTTDYLVLLGMHPWRNCW